MSKLNIKNIIINSTEFLKNKGIENPKLETELIVCHILNTDRISIYLDPEKNTTEDIAQKIKSAIIKRGKRIPLQYITGQVQFLNTIIKVNKSVLIPRPETEYMTDMIIKENKKENKKIIDICTGSGCIAIALKKNIENATIHATDICQKAINKAKQNAKKNNAEITFIKSNLFANITEKYDIIVANPPYIAKNEYNTLQPEIFYEPQKALIAKNEGIYFYQKILEQAKLFLNENGTIYLEITPKIAEQIEQMATQNNYKQCKIYKDLNKKNRIARIEN